MRGLYLLSVRSGRVTRITREADGVPEWSPGGHRIAFLREPAPGVETGYYNDLFVVRWNGSRTHRVVRGWWLDSPPYWSPKGTRLSVYGAPLRINPTYGVYVIGLSTGAKRLVVADAAGGEWASEPHGLLVRRNAPWICGTLPSRC
jgi:Tol biopolymer transport system component